MSESSNKEKMEEADDGAAQKNGSSSELKPLKRVVISGGLANDELEKEALFGQLEESQVHVKHPASVSSIKNRKHKSSSDPTFVRRVASTATNDRGFERPASQLGSRKSLASVKTRTASVSRSEYHADLKLGLKASWNLHLAFTTFVIVFGCSFLFGYNLGVLNQPDKLIKDFYNETYRDRQANVSDSTLLLLNSLTTSCFIPGGMAGAFLGGWFADTLGRKKSILLSQVFVIAGAVLSTACVAARAPELLMVGRLLVGIHSGLGNCLAPMFLTEIAPISLRGAIGTINQLSVTLGILVSSVFGLPSILGRVDVWPFLILLEVIPAVCSLCILPFLPDTPRYLLLIKASRNAAMKALKFYRQTEDIATDMEEMDTEFQQQQTASEHTPSFTMKQLLTSTDLRLPLFVACMLQVIQQFSGINAVIFYSGNIFFETGVPKSQIPYAVVGTNAVNVLMTVVSVFVMDIAGRRKLLLVPMVIMCVDLILLTITLNLKASLSWMAYISIVCIIIYVICFAVGLGPIPMMIGAELFRQAPRPKAMATAGFTNWVCTLIVALVFPSFNELCTPNTFVVFLVLMVGFVAFVYFRVPETKNKTFEEIANQFSPGDHVEVEEVVDDGEDVFAPLPPPADDDDHHLIMLDFGANKHNASGSAGNSHHSGEVKKKDT